MSITALDPTSLEGLLILGTLVIATALMLIAMNRKKTTIQR